MEFIKPKRLKKGDTIAVISPSWGGPSVFPHIYENGIKVLKEKFGLKVKEYPTAKMAADILANDPRERAKDINDAFRDKEVKAIIASIGGDDSIRVLGHLDKEAILENQKIFMGYSDTTTYNTLFNQWGLVTFNGPAIMCGFSQLENFKAYEDHIRRILFENPEEYSYTPYEEWAMNYPDWGNKDNTGKVGEKNKNNGWHWVQGNSKVEGKLFGGCIDVLDMIRGTKYWHDVDFWEDKILFFETSEEKPSPDTVKYAIRNYGVQGILDRIVGIVVGRARDYSDEETKKLEENLVKVVSEEFNHPEMPILTNVDFGHTDPQFIMPLGVRAEINCREKTLKLVESSLV